MPGSPRSSPPGRRGTGANARPPSAHRRRAGRAAARSASLAHSQCRPWNRANRRSSAAARSGTSSNSGRASPRGARESPFTLAVRERLDARRQQLDHDAERELALHHAAARAKNRHPLGLGQLRGRSEQRALADPGRSLDHHDPPRAGRGGARAHRRSAPARPRAPAGGFGCSDPSSGAGRKPIPALAAVGAKVNLRWVHVAKRGRPAVAWLASGRKDRHVQRTERSAAGTSGERGTRPRAPCRRHRHVRCARSVRRRLLRARGASNPPYRRLHLDPLGRTSIAPRA